jgi:thiamine-phosphate pyrophosphorylase
VIRYAITDPAYLDFSDLDVYLHTVSQRADWIVFRDKTAVEYASLAERFVIQARRYPFERVLLHGDWKLAYTLGADGVHVRSDQLGEIVAAKDAGLFVVASTHTFEEARTAYRHGADAMTFGPIFPTPNKGRPIGVEPLQRLVGEIPATVLALGGIVSAEQIEWIARSGAAGFASIRFFV